MTEVMATDLEIEARSRDIGLSPSLRTSPWCRGTYIPSLCPYALAAALGMERSRRLEWPRRHPAAEEPTNRPWQLRIWRDDFDRAPNSRQMVPHPLGEVEQPP